MSGDPLGEQVFEAELERLAERAAEAVVELARARRRAELEQALRGFAAEPEVDHLDADRGRSRPS